MAVGLAAIAGCGEGPGLATELADPEPASIDPIRATQLRGAVAEPLPEPVRVRVHDERGRPVPDIVVRFETGRHGGEASPAEMRTDESGVAETRWTLGSAAGPQRLRVVTGEPSPITAVITASAVAGPPERVLLDPEAVSVLAGTPFVLSPEVLDAHGNTVTEYELSWSTSNADVAQVDAGGRVVGIEAGTVLVEATLVPDETERLDSAGNTADRHHRADHDGGRTRIDVGEGDESDGAVAILAGDGQIGPVGSTLPETLEVRITDADGTPLKKVLVEWSVADDSGEVSEGATRTDGQGRASTTWTLGGTAGAQLVHAQAGSLGGVEFTAAAEPGPAETVIVTPDVATLSVGEVVELESEAADRYGNTLPDHREVRWEVEDSSSASVDGGGTVTASAPGSTRVVAEIDDAQGYATLEVTDDADPDAGSDEDEGTGDEQEPTTEDDEVSAVPDEVADLHVVETSTGAATLGWTQVDDGTGDAALYQVRYALHPIGSGWGDATVVQDGSCAGEVAGSLPGDPATCTVEGLHAGTTYDFQLVPYRGSISDGSAVYGPLSNVGSGTTEDVADAPSDDGDGDGGGSGGSSAFTPVNMPGGFSKIAETSFDAVDMDGFTHRAATITADASASGSCCNVGQKLYAVGDEGGGGVAMHRTITDAGATEVYAAVWVKFSENFRNHSSNITKIFYVWSADLPKMILTAYGDDLELRSLLRHAPDAGKYQVPNQVDRSAARLQRGTWHLVEYVVQSSSSPGADDGAMRWWLDGVLVGEYTGLATHDSGESLVWDIVEWNTIWGGTGDEVTSSDGDMYMRASHFFIGGRR